MTTVNDGTGNAAGPANILNNCMEDYEEAELSFNGNIDDVLDEVLNTPPPARNTPKRGLPTVLPDPGVEVGTNLNTLGNASTAATTTTTATTASTVASTALGFLGFNRAKEPADPLAAGQPQQSIGSSFMQKITSIASSAPPAAAAGAPPVAGAPPAAAAPTATSNAAAMGEGLLSKGKDLFKKFGL